MLFCEQRQAAEPWHVRDQRGTGGWTPTSGQHLAPGVRTVDHPTEPLPVRLFRLRLEKWLLLHSQQANPDPAVAELKSMVAVLPRESINVRPHWGELDEIMRQWPIPSQAVQEHLSQTIAPLMRFAPLWALDELQFRIWCERLTVAWLKADQAEQIKVTERIQEAVARLAENIPEVQGVHEQRAWIGSPGFWQHLDLPRLTALQGTFAPLMRYRTSTPSSTIEINLPDSITQRSWIIYGPTGEGAFAESYRERVEAWVRRLADELPALAKLKRGADLSEDELDAIATTLNQADLFVTEDTLRKAYEQTGASLPDFLKHILCEDAHLPNREERVNAAFDGFIAQHGYLRANQLNFLRAVKAAVLRHGRITRVTLSEPPLSRLAACGKGEFF
jgi:type I restriction enzyme, R subunit